MRYLLAIALSATLALPVAAQNFDKGLEAARNGDFATAVRQWRPLALGDARAQYGLGIMYRNGQGVARDYAEAAQWFRRAADQGHASAQTNLGTMYNKGAGVEQDYAQAALWFRKAAEQDDAVAQGSLGVLYAMGRSVERDYGEALFWFTLSAAQGSELGAKGRDLAAAKLTPAEIDEARRRADEWRAKRGTAGASASQQVASTATVTEGDARALLQEFFDPGADRPALTQALQPSSADYRAVYKEPFAAALDAQNQPIWQGGAVLKPKSSQTELLVVFATTDQLIDGDGVLDEFPGGYKKVLVHLRRGLAIVRFKFVEPGQTLGLAFDGLVHVNGRWVLMPKPWRALK